jgi:hypothetical protein
LKLTFLLWENILLILVLCLSTRDSIFYTGNVYKFVCMCILPGLSAAVGLDFPNNCCKYTPGF